MDACGMAPGLVLQVHGLRWSIAPGPHLCCHVDGWAAGTSPGLGGEKELPEAVGAGEGLGSLSWPWFLNRPGPICLRTLPQKTAPKVPEPHSLISYLSLV